MKKALICFVTALVMTLPVSIGIARIPGSLEWTASEQGHKFFDPLYKAFDAYGCESGSDVVFGTLLLFSFFISLVLAVAGWTAVTRLRNTNHH
ncbi:hypothetical protein [Paraburkholderia sp. ZP32-5]|uniref:hypothetical protein n=1 Tax=Paraburkholderia sp. ZP32-5 TaxID=2883245 RepID=UPI001F3C3300|nr:hypothetical protein [Paraburkholderia sp. ZP32-5]